MKSLTVLFIMTISLNSMSATNKEFSELYDKNEVERVELSRMTHEENENMNKCVNDAMNDETVYELDFVEATESCINNVLGDVHN